MGIAEPEGEDEGKAEPPAEPIDENDEDYQRKLGQIEAALAHEGPDVESPAEEPAGTSTTGGLRQVLGAPPDADNNPTVLLAGNAYPRAAGERAARGCRATRAREPRGGVNTRQIGVSGRLEDLAPGPPETSRRLAGRTSTG